MKTTTFARDIHSAPIRQTMDISTRRRGALLSALTFLTVGGSIGRFLIDDGVANAPGLAALVLLLFVGALTIVRGPHMTLLAFMMLPALFGAAPWNSPVRANLGGQDLPLYLFDTLILGAAVCGLVLAIARRQSLARDFLATHWPLLGLVVVLMLFKIVQSGTGSDTIRNAALFYYFPAVCLACAAIESRLDLRHIVPWVYLRALSLVTIAALVVIVGIALGQRDLVLTSIHQGMVQPVSPWVWLPPGSLVLLSFCAAAFLFDAATPIRWKIVLVMLLFYDALTYGNRAMWVGIIAGIGIHWVVVRGWVRGAIPAMVATIMIASALPLARDTVREHHNESSEWRLLAWGLTSVSIAEQPVLGHPYSESPLAQVLSNPDSQRAMAEADLFIDPQARSPHNSYLSLLFFGGALQGGPVLLFVILTICSLGREVERARRRGCRDPSAEATLRGTIAVAVYSAFNVVLETPIEGITYWVLMYTAWTSSRHLHDQAVAAMRPRAYASGILR